MVPHCYSTALFYQHQQHNWNYIRTYQISYLLMQLYQLHFISFFLWHFCKKKILLQLNLCSRILLCNWYTLCLKHQIPVTFSNNFNKCGPISAIFGRKNRCLISAYEQLFALKTENQMRFFPVQPERRLASNNWCDGFMSLEKMKVLSFHFMGH